MRDVNMCTHKSCTWRPGSCTSVLLLCTCAKYLSENSWKGYLKLASHSLSPMFFVQYSPTNVGSLVPTNHAGQLALHLLPIHVILHSGATLSLYDSAETGFLAPFLSAFCHLFGGDWYAGRIMVLLGAASKSSKSSELSNMYWAARNKTSNLTEFHISRCWNLAILFVYIHFRFSFSAPLEVTWYFWYSFPSWRHELIKTQVFWFRYLSCGHALWHLHFLEK